MDIIPGRFSELIRVGGSKSWSNRFLIAAALSPNSITIKNLSSARDTQDLVTCLELVGLIIKKTEQGVTIENSFPDCEKRQDETIELPSGEGGTTNRFLAAMLSMGLNRYRLLGSVEFNKRPKSELFKSLIHLGAKIEEDSAFFCEVQGPIAKRPDPIEVDCSRSTQFASAVYLLNSSLTHLEVKTINLNSSKYYFEMSKEAVSRISSQDIVSVPIDWSSASYPLVASSAGQIISIASFEEVDRFQGDSQLISILERLGFEFEVGLSQFKVVPPEKFYGLDIDCSDFLDLVPSLCFLLSNASSGSVLSGLSNLKHKESNRLEELEKLLELAGIGFEVLSNGFLRIDPSSNNLKNFHYTAPKDHRMAMVSFLFMRANKGGHLKGHECVEKSFPDFFSEMV